MHTIKQSLIEILQKCGVSGEVTLSVPPNSEMGDFAFACFPLAKELKKNPMEVARQLVDTIEREHLEHYELVQDVAAEGPYVNFYIKTSALGHIVLEEVLRGAHSIAASSTPKQRVMIEYSQPNTHKEFHIGHLRNVCIGAAMVNLSRTQGNETISANYIGDIGAHVAKCIWYILQPENQIRLEELRNGGTEKERGKWLGEMYAAASKKIEDCPELKVQVDETQQKLEGEDKDLLSLWEETKAWSMSYFKRIYGILGVSFEEWFFESEVEKPGKQLVQEMLKNGVATVGDGGAIIVDLTSYALDTFLILKSDGTSLYATKDLPLAKRKFEQYKIDKSIYVVDNRQQFYFKQLFKTLELMGFKKDMHFLGYEFVTLPEGAMASRKGNVILFEDLYNEILQLINTETSTRHLDWSAEKINNNATKLALAALKFDILKHPTDKMIVFDKKEATSFEGFSAPYVLYVIARINSLLKKAETVLESNIDYEFLQQKEEKKLLFLLGGYEAVVHKAWSDYNPSVVAKYCFDLAQAFNDFYAKHNVLQAEVAGVKQVRLALCQAVKQVLTNALKILTIETVDEM